MALFLEVRPSLGRCLLIFQIDQLLFKVLGGRPNVDRIGLSARHRSVCAVSHFVGLNFALDIEGSPPG